MDGLEERLRGRLHEVSNEAGYPRPLEKKRLWRIRASQAVYAALAVVMVAGALAGAAWGLGVGSQARQSPAAAPSSKQLVYIVDGAPNGEASEGEVLAVEANSTQFRVLTRYPLGSNIDVALSPDGTRLYGVSFVWLSETETESRIQVFDTTTGSAIQQLPLPGWQGTTGFQLTEKIVVSPDGSRVFVLVGIPAASSSQRPSQGLRTFDVASGTLLPDIAPLDGCGSAPTILPISGNEVTVVCREVNQVRFLRISDSGALVDDQRLTLPTSGATVADPNGNRFDVSYVSQAVLSPDGSKVYAVTRDGLVFVIDVSTKTLEKKTSLALPAGKYVAVPQVKVTPDGRELLLGLGTYPSANGALHADTILAVDTLTWTQTETVQTQPFSGFDVSRDGSTIFTIDYDDPALRVVGVPPAQGGTASLGNVASRPQAISVAASLSS